MTTMAPQPAAAADVLQTAVTILNRYGLTSYAELAQRRYHHALRIRHVVVIGEVKRGKSSLVNALIGRRDLLPVGVDVTTSAPVRVHTHSGHVDESTVTLLGGADTRDVPRSELTDWASFAGRHVGTIGTAGHAGAPAAASDDLPTALSLQVGQAALPDVTLIDTPGVGGLDEQAIGLAIRECHNAGVLVLVCDATTPITAPEMAVLERVKNAGGEVIVAVTKIDKNLRRWRAICADNRRLIATHLGREIPVIGVSSLRAVDAAELAATDPGQAAEVARRSGIVELRERIIVALSYGDALPKRAGLQVAVDGLAKVDERISAELTVLSANPETVADLEERRAELDRLRSHSQEWEHYLQRDLTLARAEILRSIETQMEDLTTTWTETIKASGVKVLARKPQVFTSQIEAQLAAIMEEALAATLLSLEQRCGELFDDPAVWAEIAETALSSIAPPEVVSKAVGKRTEGLIDPGLITMGVVGGGMLAALVPVLPLAGAAWVAVNLGFRAVKTGRQALVTWLRETTTATRTAIARLLDTVYAAARPELILRYRAHLKAQQDVITSQLEQIRGVAHQSAEQRSASIARLKKNQSVVQATRTAVEAQRTHLVQEST